MVDGDEGDIARYLWSAPVSYSVSIPVLRR